MGGEGAPAVLRCSEVILYNTMPSTLTFFSLGLVMWCYSISGVWGYQILPCSALGILWASSILDMYVSPLETFFLACPGLSLHLVFLVINGRIDEGGECPFWCWPEWTLTTTHPEFTLQGQCLRAVTDHQKKPCRNLSLTSKSNPHATRDCGAGYS